MRQKTFYGRSSVGKAAILVNNQKTDRKSEKVVKTLRNASKGKPKDEGS